MAKDIIELIGGLPEELQEEGTTGRDLIDLIIYESKREGIREVTDSIIKVMDCRYKAETFAIKVCDIIEAKIKELNGIEEN